jgi:Fe-S-cluster containining protein
MGKKSCDKCKGMCCKYVAMEIDTPKTKKDFENIKWFVCHKNVNVFVDKENKWNIEFLTPCEFLGKNNLCLAYKRRPKICRDYSQEECLFFNDYKEKHTFNCLKDVEDFVKKKFK